MGVGETNGKGENMTGKGRSACKVENAGEVAGVDDKMTVESALGNLAETGIRGSQRSKVCWVEAIAEDSVNELDGECMEGGHDVVIIIDAHQVLDISRKVSGPL